MENGRTDRNMIVCRRFLARELRWKDGKMTLASVSEKDGEISVVPFDGETHSTVFIDSVVEVRGETGLTDIDDPTAFFLCTTGEDELKRVILDNGNS